MYFSGFFNSLKRKNVGLWYQHSVYFFQFSNQWNNFH